MEIRLDYVTFNFSANCMSTYEVGKTLLGDNSLMRWASHGLNENALITSPHGVSWLNNSGFAPRPHRLQVSGLGCNKFAYTLPMLVSSCAKNGGETTFSRIDFAFDVIMKRDQWKSFIVHAFESSLKSDRKYKVYNLIGHGEDMTIYIGNRTSPKYFRIYNKTLQDPNYIYSENEKQIDLDVDQCVIRYEVELKRKLWNRNGNKVVYDPSPFFYQYYEADDTLAQMIKELWLSFGDDVLLPVGFKDAELTLMSKNKNFASISRSAAIEITEENVVKAPYLFDNVKNYVIEKFGQYIPFIVADRIDMQICEDKCKARIGFVPEYDIDFLSATRLDDDSDDLYDLELPWEDAICTDFVQLDIQSEERSAPQ